MKVNKTTFIREYIKAIEENRAAVFAGAGLSKPVGYVDWKGLLKDIATEIDLDVNRESDLVALAQYHINANNNDRGAINQKLIEEFSASGVVTENHKILSKLPIRYYWTTNYDRMIEKSLEQANKIVDIKIEPTNLTHSVTKSDAVLYKMHGDVGSPHNAVLSKDDYELYSQERELFTIALKGDLVTKTFLFIGFSFDDPNLEYILSRVRVLVGNNKRTHYCFMKDVDEKRYTNKEDYLYTKVQQEHRIRDLGRYGINVIIVEDYGEITEILNEIEKKFKRKNVFISGSTSAHTDEWDEDKVSYFSSELAKELIKNNKNLVSGFGLGVGRSIITGALEELYSSPRTYNNIVEDRLKLRPFPIKKELFKQYREEILRDVGFAIFIFGNKSESDGTIIKASGVYDEFKIAIQRNVIPIPVGSTGYMAKDIFDEVMSEFERFTGTSHKELIHLYSKLDDNSITVEEMINTIINIINYFTGE